MDTRIVAWRGRSMERDDPAFAADQGTMHHAAAHPALGGSRSWALAASAKGHTSAHWSGRTCW